MLILLLEHLDTLGALFVLLGVGFIAIPHRLGLYFSSIGCLLWLTFGIINGITPLLFQESLILILNTIGIIRWTKKKL